MGSILSEKGRFQDLFTPLPEAGGSGVFGRPRFGVVHALVLGRHHVHDALGYRIGLPSTSVVRMCRLSIAEAARFPQGSARYFDVILSTPHERLTAYLTKTFQLSAEASAREAHLLLGRIVHPRFPRALFGLDDLCEQLDDEAIAPDFDLEPVRKAVADAIRSIEGRESIETASKPTCVDGR